MMPRFGMELVVSPGFEHITWYGRGPAETYVDRAFERVGVYSSTVDAEWVEYAQAAGERQQGGRALGGADQRHRASACAPRGCRCVGVEAHHASRRDIEQAAYTLPDHASAPRST